MLILALKRKPAVFMRCNMKEDLSYKHLITEFGSNLGGMSYQKIQPHFQSRHTHANRSVTITQIPVQMMRIYTYHYNNAKQKTIPLSLIRMIAVGHIPRAEFPQYRCPGCQLKIQLLAVMSPTFTARIKNQLCDIGNVDSTSP